MCYQWWFFITIVAKIWLLCLEMDIKFEQNIKLLLYITYLFKTLFFLFLNICICVCVVSKGMCSAHRGQKTEAEPLGLEFEAALRHPAWTMRSKQHCSSLVSHLSSPWRNFWLFLVPVHRIIWSIHKSRLSLFCTKHI